MLDVRRLRLLRDLANLGTIAAVAQAHTYTPSAVSQQLSALEREAGLALLQRSGRGVTLTPAGELLVQHAELVLTAIERATAALAAAGSGLTGPLRVGAFPTAVRTLLPAALVALGRDHPGLELMVSELDPAGVPSALRERRLDVGLIHDYDVAAVEPDKALHSVSLLDETVFLAGPSSFAPAANPVQAARDLPWIVGTPGTLCHTVAMRVCGAAGFAPRVRHHADDFTTVLALVAAGQGVALVPQLAAEAPLGVRPLPQLAAEAPPGMRPLPRLAAEAPPGVRLMPLDTRRRTRIAYRQGASAHPAVAAAVSAIRAATKAYFAASPFTRTPESQTPVM